MTARAETLGDYTDGNREGLPARKLDRPCWQARQSPNLWYQPAKDRPLALMSSMALIEALGSISTL